MFVTVQLFLCHFCSEPSLPHGRSSHPIHSPHGRDLHTQKLQYVINYVQGLAKHCLVQKHMHCAAPAIVIHVVVVKSISYLIN